MEAISTARSESQKHLPRRCRGFAVALGMAFKKSRLRAEPRSLAQRHAGVHAEFARRIGGGRHHAALVGASAHNHGTSPQRRIVELLHRDEKRVHIDMKVGALHKTAATDCKPGGAVNHCWKC